MREALDFLVLASAKIQAKETAEKARQERLTAEKAAAEHGQCNEFSVKLRMPEA
ncbi:MAG: hypothetical protein IJW17_14295 [Lentisphaeria bacterium]|nr:hypothetical protein [Lentisphaeria bacterium]